MGARIGIADDLRRCQVTSVVRNIEAGLKGEVEYVYRVDTVAVGNGVGG